MYYTLMYYTLEPLSDQMIFIKWYKNPTSTTQAEDAFVADVQTRLDRATQPLYFLSDLRLGRVMNVTTLQKMGKLASHPKYGAGVAFSKDPLASIFVNMFAKFARSQKGGSGSGLYLTLAQALAQLEKVKPGITKNIDWDVVTNKAEK